MCNVLNQKVRQQANTLAFLRTSSLYLEVEPDCEKLAIDPVNRQSHDNYDVEQP